MKTAKKLNQKVMSIWLILLLIAANTTAASGNSAWKKINSYASLKIDRSLIKETQTQIKWHQQHLYSTKNH